MVWQQCFSLCVVYYLDAEKPAGKGKKMEVWVTGTSAVIIDAQWEFQGPLIENKLCKSIYVWWKFIKITLKIEEPDLLAQLKVNL